MPSDKRRIPSWQKDYITANKTDLTAATNCNDALLNRLPLLLPDEKMELGGKLSEASVLLYDIIVEKPNGCYESLIKALWETRQTEAARILFDGFRSRKDEAEGDKCSPLKACNIDIDYEIIMSRSVIFNGQICKLSDIFENWTKEHLKAKLSGPEFEYDYIDTFITKQKSFAVVKDTIPAVPKATFFFSTKFKLDPDIFKKSCDDIFVFQHMTTEKLEEIAGTDKNVTTWQNKLISDNASERFVLLEEEEHWNILIQWRSQLVFHLISKDNSKDYILQETHGESRILKQFIYLDDDYMLEHEIIEEITKTSAVFSISNTAKDDNKIFLANLARYVKWQRNELMVFYISIKMLFQQIGETPVDEISPLQIVIDYVTFSSPISKILLTELMEKRKQQKHAIFFEGFENVLQECFEQTINFLKRLGENEKIANFYISSSPKISLEIEEKLNIPVLRTLILADDEEVHCLVQSAKIESSNDT